jgi:hypothetical protein
MVADLAIKAQDGAVVKQSAFGCHCPSYVQNESATLRRHYHR